MRWGKVEDGWISLDYTNYDALIGGAEDSIENSDEEETSSEEEATAPTEEAGEDHTYTQTEQPSQNKNSIWGIVQVNDLLRIRSGPGTTYPVVGFLFNDKEVEIMEQTTVGSMDWGRISRGWVSMDYIITSEPDMEDNTVPDTQNPQLEEPENADDPEINTKITGRVKADALRIRSGAGTANPIVGFYYENEWVIVTKKQLVGAVYWGKTDKGWINMDYVVTDPALEVVQKPSEGTTMTVIGDCLRVRKGIGTDHRIAALLYYGDKVTVLETKEADGVLWGKVNNGWICMDYVE